MCVGGEGLGVTEIGELDEAIFEAVNSFEQVARLVVSQVAGEREFNAGEIESVNLHTETFEVEGGGLHVLGGARTSSPANYIPSTSFTETFDGQKEDPHLSRQTEAGAVVRSNVPSYLSASRGNRPLWLALGSLLTAGA